MRTIEALVLGSDPERYQLADGRVGMATFQDDRAQDPAIRRLMERVRVVVDPDIPGDLERHMWTRMTVRLTGGRSASLGPRPVLVVEVVHAAQVEEELEVEVGVVAAATMLAMRSRSRPSSASWLMP